MFRGNQIRVRDNYSCIYALTDCVQLWKLYYTKVVKGYKEGNYSVSLLDFFIIILCGYKYNTTKWRKSIALIFQTREITHRWQLLTCLHGCPIIFTINCMTTVQLTNGTIGLHYFLHSNLIDDNAKKFAMATAVNFWPALHFCVQDCYSLHIFRRKPSVSLRNAKMSAYSFACKSEKYCHTTPILVNKVIFLTIVS